MAEERVPADIRDFVLGHFRSVGHLEVFLLVSEDQSRTWNAKEVSEKLRSNQEYAESQLRDLMDQRLVKMVDGPDLRFQALCEEGRMGDLCNRLREAYATHRPSIINLIYSRPSSSIQDLADAFVFGKKN